jgi:hypothetical protein
MERKVKRILDVSVSFCDVPGALEDMGLSFHPGIFGMKRLPQNNFF